MENYLVGHGYESVELLNLLGIDASRCLSFEMSMKPGGIATAKVGYWVEIPKKGFANRKLMFQLFPYDWRCCCIGCCYYRFGRKCGVVSPENTIPESPYDYYCKRFRVANRNMVLYRSFYL